MLAIRRAICRRRLSDVVSDYVVVGAGSAGCVMANRLTEDGNVSVTLLEAGGDDRGRLASLFVQMPSALAIPMAFTDLNWNFRLDPDQSLDGRIVSCPRGRLLGGSSSINGMVYVRGNRADFDTWKAMGADGWSYADVLPYFKKAETWQGGPNEYRGGDGPLHVKHGDNPSGTPLNQAFIDAGVQAGYGAVADYNARDQEGFTKFAMTVFHSGPERGKRCSTSASYLKQARRRDNLRVEVYSMAQRIVFDGKRAVAVEYRDRRGQLRRIGVRREVIVCGGAILSPHLLQVSGIGDPDHLAAIHIPLVAASPSVGRHLQDHHELYFQQECLEPVSLVQYVRNPLARAAIGARWLLFKDGLGATNHFESGAFIRSSPNVAYPNVQFHFLPVAVSYDGKSVAPSRTGHSFQIHVGTLRSRERGSIRALSGDVRDPPRIRFQALSTEEDRREMREALRAARLVVSQPAMKGLAGAEITPGPTCQTDDDLDRYIRRHLESAYHPCGTCRIGDVVDQEGRVRGVEGVRVADASLMPQVTGGNLNAPVIMIAEKIADAIRGRKLPPARDDL